MRGPGVADFCPLPQTPFPNPIRVKKNWPQKTGPEALISAATYLRFGRGVMGGEKGPQVPDPPQIIPTAPG